LKRVNYFFGQVLTAEDFNAEQEYFRERWRRHNRCFHGHGVVCGLEVRVGRGEVKIAPGLALDCRGEEVVLSAPATVRLPSASPVASTLYLLITPAEEPADPSPATDEVTEYSRVIEGSCLALDPEDPNAGHLRRQGRGQPCGKAHGVPLARLRWIRGRWRTDPRYRRGRAR
jgi:hypothetical protein